MIHTTGEAAPHTEAVLAALTAAGITADCGQAPDGGGWQGEPGRSNFIGYAVVHPTPGTPDGNVSEPLEYLDYRAQINCYGATSWQAARLADRVKTVLVGRRLQVPGRATYPVTQPAGSAPPLLRDDSLTPPLYMAVVEITIRSQPA